jgi:hypothetical protein
LINTSELFLTRHNCFQDELEIFIDMKWAQNYRVQ